MLNKSQYITIFEQKIKKFCDILIIKGEWKMSYSQILIKLEPEHDS